MQGDCSPRDTTIQLIPDIIFVRCDVLFDDEDAGLGRQYLFAPLQVVDQLLVVEVAHAPLRPDQIILVALARFPVLEADIEDLAHPGLALETGSELGYWLNDVHLFGDFD